jgi:hypothetical protein
MSLDIYKLINDDDAWADAEEQLRHYGFGRIERKNEELWFELVNLLLEYYAEHLDYPTKEEFEQLWKQDCDQKIEKMERILLGKGKPH